MKTGAFRRLVIAACLLFSASGAWAADEGKAAATEPSAEKRRTMAQHHREMAACLESERPMAECRAEIHAKHGEEGGCAMHEGEGGAAGEHKQSAPQSTKDGDAHH
jgi:hypothetical protein